MTGSSAGQAGRDIFWTEMSSSQMVPVWVQLTKTKTKQNKTKQNKTKQNTTHPQTQQ